LLNNYLEEHRSIEKVEVKPRQLAERPLLVKKQSLRRLVPVDFEAIGRRPVDKLETAPGETAAEKE